MLTHKSLSTDPALFAELTNVSPDEFGKLIDELREPYLSVLHARRDRPTRRRAIGGGRQHKLSLDDRLLLTLIYAHAPLTQPLLGTLFGINDSNISRELQERMLPALEQVGWKDLHSKVEARRRSPRRGIERFNTVPELLEEYPALQGVLDERAQTEAVTA